MKNNRAMFEWLAGRLDALGLGGMAAVLVDAARPLAPVGAGLLWLTQPVLGALVGWSRVASWADLLEDPEALAWLGERLAGEEAGDNE